MKKIIFIFIIPMLISFKTVSAKDIYYTNKNNVELTKEQYNFIVNQYNEDYVNEITKEEIDIYDDIDFTNEFTYKTIYDYEDVMPLATYVETPKKKLTISKSCLNNGYCNIIVTAVWTNMPTVRSYDVIGARLSGTSLSDDVKTYLTTDTSTTSQKELQSFSNGFGVSVKLQTSTTKLVLTQIYKVKEQGYVYASYQHSQHTVSLSTSKKYNIDSIGYGNVFDFYGTAKNKYDNSPGVYILL